VISSTKGGKEAKEGVIAQHCSGRTPGRIGGNKQPDRFCCPERNVSSFADDIAKRLAADPKADFEPDRVNMVAKNRENIQIPRHARMEVTGNGMIAGYIHTGARWASWWRSARARSPRVAHEDFKQLVKDITLQIAAGHPYAVSRDQVPPDVIAKEREIAAQSDRLKGKPRRRSKNPSRHAR